MGNANNVNITELMTSCNFVIKDLPDNLKCVKCKSVLKDACQVPCGCSFCRVCIDDVMASGGQFCPGVSEQCGTSKLSLFSLDYIARNSISRLTVKCANNGCVVECQLANIEEHLRECPRRIVECPFRELGCEQGILCAEEIDGHLHHKNHRHSEILIGMIANINWDVEMLKTKDEYSRKKIEKISRQLVLKDKQISTLIDRINHLENENKSMKLEKADLADRLRLLTDKIEREIDERRENDELDMARVIEHVDREIAAVTEVIGSNKDEFVKEIGTVRNDNQAINHGSKSNKDEFFKQIKSVRNDNQAINHSAKSTKDDICPKKTQLQSKQVKSKIPDAKYDWFISKDIANNYLGLNSDNFTGAVHPYKYRLTAREYTERSTWTTMDNMMNIALRPMNLNMNTPLRPMNINMNTPTLPDLLKIKLCIYRIGNIFTQLTWPFEGRVVITVADRDRPEACWSISQPCRVYIPSSKDQYGESDEFVFLHSILRMAGVVLEHGLRVSCEIFPGPVDDDE